MFTSFSLVTSVDDFTPYLTSMLPHLSLLGTVLGIAEHTAAIMQDHGSHTDKCIRILQKWIDTTSNPNWTLFCQCLQRNEQFNNLRSRITEDHNL
jgi:hypothetical protein